MPMPEADEWKLEMNDSGGTSGYSRQRATRDAVGGGQQETGGRERPFNIAHAHDEF